MCSSVLANPEKAAAAMASGMGADAAFWNAWMGWSLAVKNPKTGDVRGQAAKMLATAPNQALKYLAQVVQAGGADTLAAPPAAASPAAALNKAM